MKVLYGIKLILLFMLVFFFTQKDMKEVTVSNNIVPPKSIDSAVALDDFNISLQELITLTKWNRNPFLPYYSLSTDEIIDADQMHSLILNDIYHEKGEAKAIINNKIVAEGDLYLDKKVKYIGETIVVLENDEHPFIGLIKENTNK